MNFAIAGLGIAGLIAGITNGLKSVFEIDGKTNQVVAMITGLILTSLAYGIEQDLIIQTAIPYIEWLIVSVGGGLSAIGMYDFIKTDVLGK